MPTAFPGGLDALANPTATSPRNNPSHAGQHTDANDAIKALEAKVGVDGSAVTTTLDYLVKTKAPLGVRYVLDFTGPNNEAYGAEATMTGLSQAITVPAGRRYRVGVKALLLNDANAGRVIGTVKVAGANVDRWCDWTAPASAIELFDASYIWTPSAGTYTVAAALNKNTGGGVVSVNTGAVCRMVIEDVGLAVNG